MSDFTSFRAWLAKFGLDPKTAVSLVLTCFVFVWGASIKYSAFNEHMDRIDHAQMEIKESMHRQDEQWNESLKANSTAIIEQLKQMSAQEALERNNLATRMTTLENWRTEEEKRDIAEDTSIARIGEQVSATHSDVSDLKNLLESLIIKGDMQHVRQ